jgi:DMSO/TMAO reductase YedYZ molybdopterin-dependent catalytic subunit
MPAAGSGRPAAARLYMGTVAAGVALGFEWGLHRALAQVPFAPFALADRVVRLTPGPIATYMIDHLHHAAKPLLAGACIAALLGAGAVLAVLVHRPRGAAAGGFAALVLIVGLLEPVQGSAWGSALGAAVAGLSFAISLAGARQLALARERPQVAVDLARRRALTRLGGILLAGGVLNVVAPLLATEPGARLLDFALVRRPRRSGWPMIPGLTPEVTTVPDHYIVEIDITPPVIDAGSWRLGVGGLVQRPLTLGFDELQRRFERVSEYAVLTCISNPVGGPLVGNSLWEGVRLSDLLDAAGADPGAWGLAVSCADGYSAGIPLAAARHPGSLVGIAQDGQPLTSDHGFPCRLRIPALYGMLNPKWVTEIQVVDTPFTGYWVQRGWSRTAVVRTESRIDTPGGARVGQPTWIAGVAWAGGRGIARVEVSTDAGRRWQAAQLHQPLSPWAWTQWAYLWTPPAPGRYELTSRATDGLGQPQDAQPRPPHPSGASGYPARVVEVT